MRHAYWLILAILTLATHAAAQKIEYFVEHSDDSLFTTLKAKASGKTYTLIEKSQEMCLLVKDQRDWNGDGRTDALIERVSACGGNCCPNYYFFVSSLGNGKFEISDDLADSWGEPQIEKWKDAWSVVIVSTNEGMNRDRPDEVTRRFVLRDGKGVMVEESKLKEIKSLLDLRSEIFKGSEEEHSIRYDLDGDGKPDIISARLWERWGRMFWKVHLSSGKEFETQVACKRIGVLEHKTNGVHDLVCDQDGVYHWSGTEYVPGDAAPEIAPTVQPSFDCAKAATHVEVLICHDARLAGLEVGMAQAYREALRRLAPERQAGFRSEHSAWFRNYSRTCNASPNDDERAKCVARFLTDHTAEINQRH